jgi:hypothetical protein
MLGSTSRRSLLTAGALAGFVCIAANSEGAAQHNVAMPDFSANNAGWVNIEPDFMPVPGATGPGPAKFNPAYPYYSNAAARRAGVSATYRVADLTDPNVKPWAKEIMKRENDKVLAGGIAFTPRSSCLPAGVPSYLMFPVAEPIMFIHTPKQVVMIFTGNAEVRRVFLDVPHSADVKPSWYGESVGHYEGDTLVVDTIGLSTKSYVDNYRVPHTEKLHVVERWRLADDKTLEVTIKVDDPNTFNEPWTAIHHYRQVERQMAYEEHCAENNQQMFDYKIPIAHKPDF